MPFLLSYQTATVTVTTGFETELLAKRAANRAALAGAANVTVRKEQE
jgi:hypothetical protein